MGERSHQRNLYVCFWGESKLFHSYGYFLADFKEIYYTHVLGVILPVVNHQHAREFSCLVIGMDTKREMGAG